MCRRLLLFFCVLPSFFYTASAQCSKATSLGVTEISDNAVTLLWINANADASYEVEIRSKGRTPKLKQSMLTLETSLQLEGLVPGSEYRFRVRTICADGTTSGSTKWFVFETTGMSPDEDCPKASDLKVVSATMTTATLAWSGTPYSSHYEVEVKSKGNTPEYFFEKSLIDTTVTIFGLDPSGIYHFRVRSICINSAVSGSTAWFNFIPGESSELETCPFTENLSTDSITATSAVFIWSSADQNTVYELMISDSSGNEMTFAPSTPPQFIQGLTPSTSYYISLIAHCEDGIPSRLSSSFTTMPEIVDSCLTPGNLDAVMQNSKAFLLSWDATAGTGSYDIQIGDMDTLPTILVDSNVTDAMYLFQAMDSIEEYTFRIRAICSSTDVSEWSDFFLFPVASDSLVSACDTPSDFGVDTVIGNNAFLSWSSTGADSYMIEIRSDSILMEEVVNTNADSVIYVLSQLEPMTNYEVRIKGLCERDEGPYSTIERFTTGEEMSICLPVTDLFAERLDESTARLTWNGLDSTTYQVEVRAKDPSSTNSLSIPAVDPELIVSGLSPSLNYEFRVSTICGVGDSSFYTSWIGFNITDTSGSLCDAPANLKLDSATSTEAWVSWQGIDTLEYQVLLKERDTLVPYQEILTSDHFVYLDSLMPETEYELYVQTLCGDELSPLSEVLYFTTLMSEDTIPDSLCMAPSELRLDSVSTNNAWITWIGPDSLLFHVEVIGDGYEYSETVAGNSIALSDLLPNSDFTLRVRTICNEMDSSEWSEDFIFQTLEMSEEPEDSCKVPVAQLLSIGETSARGSWTASSSGAYYLIEVENIGLTPRYQLITTTRDTTYLFEDLVPGGTYQWKVAAFCVDGTFSDCTEWMVFETDGVIDCPAPEGLSVNGLTTTGATLAWDGGQRAIDYEVEIQSIDSTTFYGMSNILVANQLSVKDLVPGGSYQFKVNVQCLDGSISEDSEWFVFQTLVGQDTGAIAEKRIRSVQLIYPNPVRETMNVRLPAELNGNSAIIQLTDMMGKIVLSRKEARVLKGDEFQFEVGNLGEGVYQLSIKSDDTFFHELVMITR